MAGAIADSSLVFLSLVLTSAHASTLAPSHPRSYCLVCLPESNIPLSRPSTQKAEDSVHMSQSCLTKAPVACFFVSIPRWQPSFSRSTRPTRMSFINSLEAAFSLSSGTECEILPPRNLRASTPSALPRGSSWLLLRTPRCVTCTRSCDYQPTHILRTHRPSAAPASGIRARQNSRTPGTAELDSPTRFEQTRPLNGHIARSCTHG